MNELSKVDFKNQRSSWEDPEKKMYLEPSKKLILTARIIVVMIVLAVLYVAAKVIFQF